MMAMTATVCFMLFPPFRRRKKRRPSPIEWMGRRRFIRRQRREDVFFGIPAAKAP